jgi:hypothetical protein
MSGRARSADRRRRRTAAIAAGNNASVAVVLARNLCNTLIYMMEPTQDWYSAEWFSVMVPLPGWRLGCRPSASLMGPIPIAVGDVLASHAGQRSLAQDEGGARALASYAPGEPRAGRVRLRRTTWCTRHPDPACRRHRRELNAIRAVAVTPQEARTLLACCGLAQSLRRPGVGRRPRRADMDDAARAERDDAMREQRSEAPVGDLGDVAGPGVLGVVAQESRPVGPRGLGPRPARRWIWIERLAAWMPSLRSAPGCAPHPSAGSRSPAAGSARRPPLPAAAVACAGRLLHPGRFCNSPGRRMPAWDTGGVNGQRSSVQSGT